MLKSKSPSWGEIIKNMFGDRRLNKKVAKHMLFIWGYSISISLFVSNAFMLYMGGFVTMFYLGAMVGESTSILLYTKNFVIWRRKADNPIVEEIARIGDNIEYRREYARWN
jgi:hypothetical protein